jgi:phenylacetate-CoA ligase
MGIEPGMPEAELWGKTTISGQKSKVSNQKFTQNPKLRTQNFINRFRSYNAFSFNDVYLEAVVADMQKYKPRLIRGYLSAILLLADYIKRNKISGINPLAVSSTAETLFPEYRKKIEEIFQAPLFNQYGCGECNSIAFECKEHKGMHITMEHCVLEQDEENNFIVTNLDNYSQPFIRYKNGDKGSISHESCSCGVASPRITEVRGRANENIILKNGASVNGIFFANLLDQNGFINNDKMLRFQVVQNTAGMIKFKAEVKSPMPDKDEMNLRDSLMPFFHAVDISQHAFLDSGKGGKFRYIVSELNSD